MIRRQLTAVTLGLAVGLCWSAARAADPAPQYSAGDIAKTFADQPAQPPATPAGECEKKGMVTGDDGVCEPVKNERGFNLPTRASPGQPHTLKTEAGDGGSTRMATSVAPPISRHRAPPSRDLLITFKLGSSELTDQGRANARVFAQALMLPELAGTHFQLAGYTDASGDKDRNLTLSQQRAEAVKSFLMSLGVDGARLDSHGYGAQDFISASNPMAPENRRVVATKVE